MLMFPGNIVNLVTFVASDAAFKEYTASESRKNYGRTATDRMKVHEKQ